MADWMMEEVSSSIVLSALVLPLLLLTASMMEGEQMISCFALGSALGYPIIVLIVVSAVLAMMNY